MPGTELLQQAIDTARSTMAATPESQWKEMELLIRDLEESRVTVFVRTAEAKPMIERCARAVSQLKEALDVGEWNTKAEEAFEEFDRAVSKLRSTIMVRTQRAT